MKDYRIRRNRKGGKINEGVLKKWRNKWDIKDEKSVQENNREVLIRILRNRGVKRQKKKNGEGVKM